MNNTHTPGPWRIEGQRIVSLADGTIVLDMQGAMNGDDVAADARLIAASPQMHELITRLYKAMQTGVITEGMEMDTKALLASINTL